MLSNMLSNVKNTFRPLKNRLKRDFKVILKRAFKLILLNSKYIDSPREYWITSRNYYEFYCSDKSLNYLKYSKLLEPGISIRSLPKTIHRKTHWKFEGRELHQNPETFVITIPNGRVIGNNGSIVTHDDRLLFDVSLQFGISINEIEYHDIFQYLKLPKRQNINSYIAVISTARGGYFHWLTDALPRIHILKNASPINLDKIDKILVPKGIPAIYECLEMLEIPASKLLFDDPNLHIEADCLIVPSLPGTTGDPPNWVLNFLREAFLSKADTKIRPIRRIYISRSKASYRKVTNEAEVIQFLSKLGFELVSLEDFNFSQQIAILSLAEIVVAPHGAGLTNLVWCNPGTKVLEIFSPNYVNVCYWAISNQLGLEYHYLLGRGKHPDEYLDPHLMGDNITVNLDELNQALELMLS